MAYPQSGREGYNPNQRNLAQEIWQTNQNVDPLSGTTAATAQNAATGAPAGGTGGPMPGQNTQLPQRDFNSHMWDNPEDAMNNVMERVFGTAGNVNNPFYQQHLNLMPGLQWLQRLGSTPWTDLQSGWLGGATNWMGGGGDFGAFGTDVNGAIQQLFNGANSPEVEGFLDLLKPNEVIGAIGQMLQASHYGGAPPEILAGIQAQLENELNRVGTSIVNLTSSTPGLSHIDAMRQVFSDDIINRYFG